MSYDFRTGPDGMAHICPTSWVTALCGAQGRRIVEQGVFCPRCLDLATEPLATDPEGPDHD